MTLPDELPTTRPILPYTDKGHVHKWRPEEINAAIEALQAEVEKLKNPEPTPPDPTPDPGPPVRTIQAGSHSNIDVNVPGLWLFEPGAIVKGLINWTAKDVILRDMVTTSELEHETPLRLQQGASGRIEGGSITHIGTPKNGSAYSTISCDDGGRGVGFAGPLTIDGLAVDARTFGHFGIETWGIIDLIIRRCTFKGNGAAISIPRSDGALIELCDFDLTSKFWGIELSDVDNVTVQDNNAYALGSVNMGQTWRAFVQCHPGGSPTPTGYTGAINGTTIRRNRLNNYPALVNCPPPWQNLNGVTTIRDNPLTNVGRLMWQSNPWPGQTDIAA